jgi:hypothetical protein
MAFRSSVIIVMFECGNVDLVQSVVDTLNAAFLLLVEAMGLDFVFTDMMWSLHIL